MVAPAETTSERNPRRFPRDGFGALGSLAVQEQHIEIRTGGTANSDVTSQTVWSAAYVNAAVLQDTYSAGVIQPNSRIYFQQDANWDTTSIVGYDATTGTWGVTQRYVYDSYGNVTVLNADWSTPPAGTNPIVNNLYQGMTFDPVTGLYYERHRNYSPSLGTWTSQDPAGYINGANTYQFVMSNPVGNIDPKGTNCDEYLKDAHEQEEDAAKDEMKAAQDLNKLDSQPPPQWWEQLKLRTEAYLDDAEANVHLGLAAADIDLYWICKHLPLPPGIDKCPEPNRAPAVEPVVEPVPIPG